jgi:hypothetical protein
VWLLCGQIAKECSFALWLSASNKARRTRHAVPLHCHTTSTPPNAKDCARVCTDTAQRHVRFTSQRLTAMWPSRGPPPGPSGPWLSSQHHMLAETNAPVGETSSTARKWRTALAASSAARLARDQLWQLSSNELAASARLHNGQHGKAPQAETPRTQLSAASTSLPGPQLSATAGEGESKREPCAAAVAECPSRESSDEEHPVRRIYRAISVANIEEPALLSSAAEPTHTAAVPAATVAAADAATDTDDLPPPPAQLRVSDVAEQMSAHGEPSPTAKPAGPALEPLWRAPHTLAEPSEQRQESPPRSLSPVAARSVNADAVQPHVALRLDAAPGPLAGQVPAEEQPEARLARPATGSAGSDPRSAAPEPSPVIEAGPHADADVPAGALAADPHESPGKAGVLHPAAPPTYKHSHCAPRRTSSHC